MSVSRIPIYWLLGGTSLEVKSMHLLKWLIFISSSSIVSSGPCFAQTPLLDFQVCYGSILSISRHEAALNLILQRPSWLLPSLVIILPPLTRVCWCVVIFKLLFHYRWHFKLTVILIGVRVRFRLMSGTSAISSLGLLLPEYHWLEVEVTQVVCVVQYFTRMGVGLGG